ncbi:MAG: hypothetical protein ACREEV_18485, partial [Dongiaceae bacterium]
MLVASLGRIVRSGAVIVGIGAAEVVVIDREECLVRLRHAVAKLGRRQDVRIGQAAEDLRAGARREAGAAEVVALRAA